MPKIGRQGKEDTVNRAVKAVLFAQSHRSFTIEDLSAELGINRVSGRKWLAVLSLHLPIIELKPARYVKGYGVSRLPALYGLREKI